MSTNPTSAFLLSTLLHGSIALLMFLAAFFGGDSKKEEPKIIELVAGEGDNFAANVAAALGTPGIKLTMPDPLPPAPAPLPVEVAPPAPQPPAPPVIEKSPITPAPEPPAPKPTPAKKPVVAPTPPAPGQVPDFAKQVKIAAARRAARLEAQYKKQLEAERQRQAKAEAAAKAAAAQQAKVKHIDAEGISKGVMGGSTENTTGGAKGKALTREETDLMASYTAYLKARVKENHEKPTGLSDRLTATVAFFVAADGSISRPRILKSSRSSEFDKSVIDAIRRTESIGKRPDGRSEEFSLDFTMRDEDAN